MAWTPSSTAWQKWRAWREWMQNWVEGVIFSQEKIEAAERKPEWSRKHTDNQALNNQNHEATGLLDHTDTQQEMRRIENRNGML